MSGHHLCIDARDLDASKKAGFVVGLDDVSAIDLLGTNTAVVWALGSRETSMGPSVWPVIRTEQSVLLFQTKPCLLRFVGIHQTDSFVTIVEFVGGSIVVPCLAHDEDVLATSEWIWVYRNRTKVDIGVVAGSLAGGGTVEVPLRQLLCAFYRAIESLMMFANQSCWSNRF